MQAAFQRHSLAGHLLDRERPLFIAAIAPRWAAILQDTNQGCEMLRLEPRFFGSKGLYEL